MQSAISFKGVPQSAISFKGIGIHGVAAPSEACDKIGVVEVRIW